MVHATQPSNTGLKDKLRVLFGHGHYELFRCSWFYRAILVQHCIENTSRGSPNMLHTRHPGTYGAPCSDASYSPSPQNNPATYLLTMNPPPNTVPMSFGGNMYLRDVAGSILWWEGGGSEEAEDITSKRKTRCPCTVLGRFIILGYCLTGISRGADP